jgi:hypothetical protein
LTQAQGLQHAVTAGREQVAAQARELGAVMRRLQRRVDVEAWSGARSAGVLEATVQAGLDGEFRDYLGAEQAVMAIDLLLIVCWAGGAAAAATRRALSAGQRCGRLPFGGLHCRPADAARRDVTPM